MSSARRDSYFYIEPLQIQPASGLHLRTTALDEEVSSRYNVCLPTGSTTSCLAFALRCSGYI